MNKQLHGNLNPVNSHPGDIVIDTSQTKERRSKYLNNYPRLTLANSPAISTLDLNFRQLRFPLLKQKNPRTMAGGFSYVACGDVI